MTALNFTTPSFNYDIASTDCKNGPRHQHERPIIELCDRTKLSHHEKKLLFPVDDDSDDEGENDNNDAGNSNEMSLGSCDIFDDLSYDDDDAFASFDEDDNDTTITTSTASASTTSSSSSTGTRRRKVATAATATSKQNQQRRRRRRFTRKSGEPSSSSAITNVEDEGEEALLHLSYSSYILTSSKRPQNPVIPARLPLHMELTY